MRRTLGKIMVAAFLLAWIMPVRGQTLSTPNAGPEISRLKQLLIGKWQTTEQHAKSDLIPAGGSGTGVQTFRPGPGGLTLIIDNKSHNTSSAFSGHGVICWDNNESVYKSYWFDSTQSAGEIQTGRWEGDDLVFRGKSYFMGKSTTFKLVYTDFHTNSFTFYTESSVGEEPSQRMMTIRYSRVKETK